MNQGFPYPTPVEILRYMATIFDIKFSNVLVEASARKKFIEPEKLRDIYEGLIIASIKRYIGNDFGVSLGDCMGGLLDFYLKIVSSYDASGVSRERMLISLSSTYANVCLLELLFVVQKITRGPHPTTLLDSEASAITNVISWLEISDREWNEFYKDCQQKERDKITSWKRGEKLPSLMSIGNTANSDSRSRILLFVSRALDAVGKTEEGRELLAQTRALLLIGHHDESFPHTLASIQKTIYENNKSTYSAVSLLHSKLAPKAPKENPGLIHAEISRLRAHITLADDLADTEYFIDWLEARWHVFSGDISEAIQFYKRAVELCLYRTGDQQEIIINEALLVSSVKSAPDKVFIRELRWMQLLFGYESNHTDSPESSVKFEDWADNGEIEIWQSQFRRYFPDEGLFPGVTSPQKFSKIGPMIVEDLCVDDPKLRKTKPDYRNPDRKIKVGDNWQRKVPQLVWFTRPLRDFNVCEKLLEKGAGVNVHSESGQTPIMAALENMDLTQLDNRDPDDRFFWLYSTQAHLKETINRKTNKKKLLPILLAVDTGRLDVVEAVLSMGADPNLVGSVDDLSALMRCLELISIVKKPETALRKITISDATLEAIKRQSMGATGFSKKHHREFLNQLTEDHHKIFYKNLHLQMTRIIQAFDIKELRKIAMLLINAGADANMEKMGQSPMLLAAELNEADIFKAMLSAGADSSRAYVDKYTNERLNCWHIANRFKSIDVRAILDNLPRVPP